MKMAVWGHPHSEFPEGQDSSAEIRDGLSALREAGVSVYIPFVLSHGKTYFTSETLGAPERELLRPVMDAARELEMTVHPILGLGAVGIADTHLYQPSDEAWHVPDWAKSWPCAAWAENHEITVAAAKDLVEAYRPAGIHLDYVRYPNSSVLADNPCECERCCELRLAWLGKPVPDARDLRVPGIVYKEIQMRAHHIRSLVESMHALTDRYGIALSAAVRARYYRDALCEGQDWAAWCRDGLLDFVCPMSYNPCLGRFARFIGQHRRLLSDTAADWLAGIGRRSSLGELDPQAMARQIRFVRAAGADGVCIFHANALGEEDLAVLRQIAAEDAGP